MGFDPVTCRTTLADYYSDRERDISSQQIVPILPSSLSSLCWAEGDAFGRFPEGALSGDGGVSFANVDGADPRSRRALELRTNACI